MECEKAFMEAKEVLSPQLWSIMTLKFHSNLQLMPQPMGWERLFLMFSQTGQSVPLPMSSRYCSQETPGDSTPGAPPRSSTYRLDEVHCPQPCVVAEA